MNPATPDAPDAPTRRRKPATIRDVAEAAGVSTATVSKFINGGQRFTREVEERVTPPCASWATAPTRWRAA